MVTQVILRTENPLQIYDKSRGVLRRDTQREKVFLNKL
jgi:hypothetical protein